uniref:Transcription factor 20-like n=1 Tax=Gouania willdenowi TaxID=441366 RepID=A0A8C5EUK6_GOUWI
HGHYYTSCLQLGRISTHGQQQCALICCLCGQSANAMDLGDLHGPYYPEGFQPSSKDHCSSPGLKEEPKGHSDSHTSVRSRKRRCCVPPTSLAVRQGAKLKKRRQCSGDGLGSPSAKRARCDGGVGDVDWYSPPVLPLEPCEYWLHEDCGVWSAGVFLVRGRVYGLEEAVRAAQETVCSACDCTGATLGCCFRGCVHKYHYRCALESDCVLIEENFAMKCRKHKNKSSKGKRWECG